MPLSDYKLELDQKDLRYGPKDDRRKRLKEIYGPGHEPHNNYFFGLLALVYDGYTDISELKKQMRLFFISSTGQLVVEDADVEEYIQQAKKRNLIRVKNERRVELTDQGKEFTKLCYHINNHTSYWMGLFLSEYSVMLITAVFLIILSFLKIFTGFSLNSQGMINEGFENLTDLIKIAIIGLLGIKYKKERLASFIIVGMMIFTGGTLIYSGIDSLFRPSVITPTIQAYVICVLSMCLNGALLMLKSIVGRISGNLSLLSDSKDSAVNIKISVGVLIGLTFAIFNYYFVDAVIGIFIGILIFKEGFEIIFELAKGEEEFDITEFKVVADNIYDNRLTEYILGSIRREELTKEKLLSNFERGLELGRKYYVGFADFFYDGLGKKIAEKHVDKLIESSIIEMDSNNHSLYLTDKGLKQFYKSKAKEFKYRAKTIYEGSKVRRTPFICLGFLILLILVVFVYAEPINTFLSSF